MQGYISDLYFCKDVDLIMIDSDIQSNKILQNIWIF